MARLSSMIRRRRKKTNRPSEKEETPAERGRRLSREYDEKGFKPVKDLKDLAFGTPEDADELLDAIREHRRKSRGHP
jgi:hypothetical protein